MAYRAWRLNRAWFFALAVGVLLAAWSTGLADHSKMDPNASCYACHTLKTSELLSATKSIRTSKPKMTKLADNTTWAAGMPLSCDFCHQSATDVPSLVKSTKTSRHPVDTIGNETDPTREISCNDCHNAYWDSAVPANDNHEVTPKTLLTQDNTDGYPDHKGLGSDNQYAHNLRSNPPHLSKGYTGSMSFSSTTPRISDGTFWSSSLDGSNLVCFVCHGGSSYQPPFRGASGRSQYNVMSDYAASGSAAGHKINANFGSSGALAQGSKLPCYDCHASHGSASRRLILDGYFASDNGMRNIEGSSSLAVNTFTSSSPGPTGDIAVCAGCHNTGLAATAFSATGKVEKLNPMDPFVSRATSHSVVGSWASPSTTRGCLGSFSGCHASPHNPIGESLGGLGCSTCHSTIYTAMQSSTGYHHAILSDNATAPYPTNATPGSTPADRTCRICHVDHDFFSTQVDSSHLRARNLRQSISVQPNDNVSTASPLNTDYDNTLGGVCTSCHVNVQTKSATNLRSDNVWQTSVVSQALYGVGAHNYAVTSPYIKSHFSSDNSDATSIFRANCTKCHNDTMQKSFQDNNVSYPNQFGLHDSGAGGGSVVDKLLGPLGATSVAEVAGENFCYRCHSHSTDTLLNGPSKTQDGYDWYGGSVKAMTQASESVFGEFQKTSRHPVKTADQKSGTAVVSCGNCHNAHAVGRTADNAAVSNPDNTYAMAVYTTMAGRLNFCLACHDGAPPDNTVSATRLVPARVRVDNAVMNKSTYAARAHWTSGQGQMFMSVLCTNCHDRHGGTFAKLLDNGVRYHRGPQWTPPACNTCHGFTSPSAPTGNNNTECFRCHTYQGTGYPAIESDRTAGDNGYFAAPGTSTRFSLRYAGKTVYEGSYSPHNNTAKTFSGFDNVTRTVSDCRNCHDVHGTANPYAQLKGTYRSGNYGLCFQCHGKTTTATDNISRYYPTAAGGDNTDSASATNAGHNIKTAGGYLPQYAALPCYDCHVTHGSKNSNTQLKSDQTERGWSGLGDTKYGSTPSDNAADNNSRRFCFGCHVASDGSGTATVENLSQAGANRLKLPSTYGIEEHKGAGAQGCHRCHYGKNYNDNTYGPHYPATGLCDTCHESQGTKSAGVPTYNGAHQRHVDNTTYRFACKECHSWTKGSGQAVHKNDNSASAIHAEVAFDNQGSSSWDNILYAVSTTYKYRSLYANPYGAGVVSPAYSGGTDNGTDGKQALLKWRNGNCSNVWCHSTAHTDNVARTVAWQSGVLPSGCTGCHGGGKAVAAASRMGAANNGSPAHLAHINSNLRCYKCHYGTITDNTQDTAINVYDNHVNGVKNVRFPSDVGGTWDNTNKTCSATYCHGTPATLPKWDNLSTVSGCGVCHQNQGAGATGSYAGPHHPHTVNSKLRIACETCHALNAAAHSNTIHAGGPDNAASGKTAEILYTDNAQGQTYSGVAFLARNLWNNPFDNNAALTPAYAGGASSVGNDAVNAAIHWTQGTCSQVWCHSNAKPLGWKGVAGNNAFRSPPWAFTACNYCHNPRPTDVNCTPCHRGVGTAAAMAGADNLSNAHITHAATDRYYFSCDECHAWTVPNDSHGNSGLGIIAGTGHDNHVDGIKTVKFGTTLRTTGINQQGGTYDNAAYRCYNTYCHSNGTDNATFNTAAQRPEDNTISWNSAAGGTCRTCHKYTAASGNPMVSNAHDNHVNNYARLGKYIACYQCHSGTVDATDNVPSTRSYLDNHVNGIKNVYFGAGVGAYDNTRTCSNTYCHQQGNALLSSLTPGDNLTPAWTDNWASLSTICKGCHGSQTGTGYSNPSYYGEPNYDNNIGGSGARNSHYVHVNLTAEGVNCLKCHPDVVTAGNAIDNARAAMHMNDNVEVAPGLGETFVWDQATKSCTNIVCHQGNSTPVYWGGPVIPCTACHSFSPVGGAAPARVSGPAPSQAPSLASSRGARSATTPAIGPAASTLSVPAPSQVSAPIQPRLPKSGRHIKPIARIRIAGGWDNTGHGRTTGNYVSGNPPANASNRFSACTNYCHSGNAMLTPHTDNAAGRNFFRLATGGGGVARAAIDCTTANNVCNQCHALGGALAAQATRKVGAAHYGAKHSSPGNNGGYFCWDCHDPHGGGNDFMIRDRVAARTDRGANGAGLGIPIVTRATSFTGSGTYTWGSYVKATFDGLCQVCHSAGTGIRHFHNSAGGYDNVHNPGIRCTTCHTHKLSVPVIGSVADDTFKVPGISGKLVAGDKVTAILVAVPGGKASFDMGKVKGIPMAEVPASPGGPGIPAVDNGTYRGTYTIRPGDDYIEGRVVGQFVSSDNVAAVPLASASKWTIDTQPRVAYAIDKTDLPADSASKARVSLVVKDANGNVLKGRRFKLTLATTDEYTGLVGAGNFGKDVGATVEALWQGQTDAWGTVEFDYKAGFAAKTVILAAKDLESGGVAVDYITSYKEASIDIMLTPPRSLAAARRGLQYVIKIEATRTVLTADGQSRSVIRATVTDPGGKAVAGDNVVFTLSSPNGSIRTIEGVTNASGVATAEYIAGKKIGIVVVTATDIMRNVSASVSIVLLADAPAKIYLKARPESLPADGFSRSDINVKVTDINDNPNDNTKVDFRIAKGTGKLDSQERVTDRFGEALNRFTAGTVPGIATVLATVRSKVPTLSELAKAQNVLFVPYSDQGEEIRVSRWLKKKGDTALKGEPVVEYTIGRGDTAYTLNAPYDCRIDFQYVEYWDRAQTGDTLAQITPVVIPGSAGTPPAAIPASLSPRRR